MKWFAVVLVLLTSSVLLTAQEGRVHPAPNLGESIIPDAPVARLPAQQVTPAQLRSESAQLQQLVQSVQPQLDKASQGVMDKDLLNKLKEIEKLAKKLRNELRE